jgi:voltage-gated potassium channel
MIIPDFLHEKKYAAFRSKWFVIIFSSDTKHGKLFDVILLWAIFISVCVVMLSSVHSLDVKHHTLLLALEWLFTIIFTIEYFLRIYVVKDPRKYILSFWGIIDLLSTIPTYLTFFIVGGQYLLIIRVLRLLRIFKIFSLKRYSIEANSLANSLKSSGAKITVFFAIILIIVILMGTIMYIIEGPRNGFISIPFSIYWAIVTITTVGYGDVTPATVLGQALSSALMIIGYAVIAVPTGIMSVEMSKSAKSNAVCPNCGNKDNDANAKFCKVCSNKLEN